MNHLLKKPKLANLHPHPVCSKQKTNKQKNLPLKMCSISLYPRQDGRVSSYNGTMNYKLGAFS